MPEAERKRREGGREGRRDTPLPQPPPKKSQLSDV